tara:strand:- start:196 stop:378 length:183 start_codon:yes stop_codon:yes gene_type:complete
MTERNKKPDFKKYLKDNQKILGKFCNRKGEKYAREPWMLKTNPATDWTMEIICEDDQSGN